MARHVGRDLDQQCQPDTRDGASGSLTIAAAESKSPIQDRALRGNADRSPGMNDLA